LSIDENITFAEIALKLAQEADADSNIKTKTIEEILFESLGLDLEKYNKEQIDLIHKNFDHLICVVISDLKSINDRLLDYQKRYKAIENVKTNEAEYARRKIIYFCDLNKEAREEITTFITKRLVEFLLDNNFDTLRRFEEDDKLSILFYNRRYKYAYYKSFYDMDYEYGTVVKLSELFHDIPLEKWLDKENEYLSLKQNDEMLFKKKLRDFVDNKNILNEICKCVKKDYHLKKREEIFDTLNYLFYNKKYQSFLALGLLQLEGMFYDFCQIKYGDSENQGTLVEKVDKALKVNEYKYMKFYPYFAFDVPIMRNDVAHKGMVEEQDLEEASYNLILDLYTVCRMVSSESYDKFVGFIMVHEEMVSWESEEPEKASDESERNKKLVMALFQNRNVIGDSFWKVLKSPELFREEIDSYKTEDLEPGYIDIPMMVAAISILVRQGAFWKAVIEILNQYSTPTMSWKEMEEFAKFMKDDYIAELDGEAKEHCIEISKFLHKG
jgi:hypothetical protein